MPVQAKKRLPRIDRYEEVKVHEDENQHLWAVSYSDFLMALLSFFILFFSIDTPQRTEMILQLVDSFQSSGQVGKGNGSGSGAGDVRGVASDENHRNLGVGLFSQLSELDVSLEDNRQSLVINFPNDFFSPGKHKIDENQKRLISQFLEVLKPYQNKINIYFEGHADSSPVQKSKSSVLVDNYVLSSLRAASALRLAKAEGFLQDDLYIHAAGSNIRNSRSLSVRIEAKKVQL